MFLTGKTPFVIGLHVSLAYMITFVIGLHDYMIARVIGLHLLHVPLVYMCHWFTCVIYVHGNF